MAVQDAVKRLESALDSEDILNGLDTNTLLLQPENPAPGELPPPGPHQAPCFHTTAQHQLVVVPAESQPKPPFQPAMLMQSPQADGVASRLSEIRILDIVQRDVCIVFLPYTCHSPVSHCTLVTQLANQPGFGWNSCNIFFFFF